MDKLRIKIQIPSGVTERDSKPNKRLKADNEYLETGWRVLGVPYGGPIKGRDLDGEAFHEDTDIWLKTGDQVNVTYYHGFGPDVPDARQEKPVVIGRATYTGKDDRGHWFEPVLDFDEPLAQRIIMAGVKGLRASSGAVSHLVRQGKGGLIDTWPVGELALFDTNEWRLPANDFAVIEAKADSISEAIPEASADAVDAVEMLADAQNKSTIIPEEESKMTDNLEMTPEVEKGVEVQFEKVDMQPIMDELKAQRSVIDELKAAMPGKEKGQATVKSPDVVASLGEKDEMKAYMHFVRTGQENSVMKALKASNNTDMNITTAEDGQYLVPTGHYQNVITRRDEAALFQRLGVTEIPGIGTTVNVPYDNEADGEFVVATETAEFDDDAPATGRRQLTFKKYAKIIRISHELLRDEDSRLEAFLANWVGRGMAKTHNDLLITEVETNGTALKTFASATAVAVGELEDMMFQADMVSYLDGGSANWVMSGPSYSKVISVVGNARSYAQTPQGAIRESILGFPVHFTNKADTIAASKKSIFFGDWSQVGVRNGQGLQMIRDPYTRARYGQIELVYLFDCVYGVMNAEAIGYGIHPSA